MFLVAVPGATATRVNTERAKEAKERNENMRNKRNNDCRLIGGMFFNYLSISVNLLRVSVHAIVFGQNFVHAYQYISVQ